MRSYTIYDLAMNVDGNKYILPFNKCISDDEIMNKVKDLFNDIHHINQINKNININKNKIEIKCLYEGYDDYYPYSIQLEVFRLKYDDKNDKNDKTQRLVENEKEVEDGQWMISMRTENEQGSLLEELLDLNILPEIVKKAGFKDYSYKKNII
jgi:hypothetical protein